MLEYRMAARERPAGWLKTADLGPTLQGGVLGVGELYDSQARSQNREQKDERRKQVCHLGGGQAPQSRAGQVASKQGLRLGWNASVAPQSEQPSRSSQAILMGRDSGLL